MTSAKCFLGCTNVRYGARVVAILDFWISVILMIKCLSLLNPFHNSIQLKDDIDTNTPNRSYSITYNDNINYYDSSEENVVNDFIVYGHLFLICVFLYINYYLKDSTYDYKVHKISQWLAINTIFLSVYAIATTYVAVKYYRSDTFFYSIPFCVMHGCQIYVVKSFYDERLEAAWPYAARLAARFAADGPVAVRMRNAADPRLPDGRPPTTTAAHPVYRVQGAAAATATLADHDAAAAVTDWRQLRYGLPATATVYPPLPATAPAVFPPLPATAGDPVEVQVGLPSELLQGNKPPAYSTSYDNVAV